MTRIHKNYYEIYVSFIIIVTETGYVRYKIERVVTPDLQLARQTENIFFLRAATLSLIRSGVERPELHAPPRVDRHWHPINLFILVTFTCALNHDCRRTADTRFVFERS